MTVGITSLGYIVILSMILTILDSGYGEMFRDRVTFETSSRNVVETRRKSVTPMHKALLTQRGYIQFLRWELPVPEIEEFTFCVWVKSTNLTYPHSIFSYSKNEEERLVRAWISSRGRSIHLEIDNVEIFASPVDIREHRWYHICQSWSNAEGRYALWIDARKKKDGYATKMAGHVIPSNGDMVLGQEYTDFDKGLEEGIEGAVLGFNLILSSAFRSTRPYFERNQRVNVVFQGEGHSIGYETGLSPLIVSQNSEDGQAASSFSNVAVEEERKKRKFPPSGIWGRKDSAAVKDGGKPLGEQLVDVSFRHCEQGRGSPFIGGKLMLISWTRTPVKVFGGAIVKNVKSDCGNF